MRYGLFNEAAGWFQSAAEIREQHGGVPARLTGRNFTPYLPCYYRGISLFNARRYFEANRELEACKERIEVPLKERAIIDLHLEIIEAYRRKLARIDEIYEAETDPAQGHLHQIQLWLGELREMVAGAYYQGRELDTDELKSLRDRLNAFVIPAPQAPRSQARPTGPQGDNKSSRPTFPPDTAQIVEGTTPAALRFRQLVSPSLVRSEPAEARSTQTYRTVPANEEATADPYKIRKAILIGGEGIAQLDEAFDRLEVALRLQGFDKPIRFVNSEGKNSTKERFVSWANERHVQGWLRSEEKALVFVVFVAHACKLDGNRVYATLTGPRNCQEAERTGELEELGSRSLNPRDVKLLLDLQEHQTGDLAIFFDTCHSGLFLGDCDRAHPGHTVQEAWDNSSSAFVAAGRMGDNVEQAFLVEGLSRKLIQCSVDNRSLVVGHDIFFELEREFRELPIRRFLKIGRCLDDDGGDLLVRRFPCQNQL